MTGLARRLPPAVVEELRVVPGEPAALARRSTSATQFDWVGPLGRATAKDVAEEDLAAFREALSSAQELLFASDTWALLVLFQGMDASGKDGTIKHVLSGIDPQGCTVRAFKAPSAEEQRHDFLWRCVTALPSRGLIGIFNRSYYEEVLVVRLHPELLAAERLPVDPSGRPGLDARMQERFEDINAFERHLERNGTHLVKVFLHVSEEEQRERLLARADDPSKRWKLSPDDVAERGRFDSYQAAYEAALTATSTPWAPWYVVPADHKPAMRALVGGVIVHEIEQLRLELPGFSGTPQELEAIRQALRRA